MGPPSRKRTARIMRAIPQRPYQDGQGYVP